MKKLCAWVAVVVIAALCGALAEEAAGIWQFTYYVDEFRMPTDEGYIRNAAPIEGIYSNAEVTDQPLGVVMTFDDDGVALALYENGTDLVKNSQPDARAYDVILRDADGSKTTMTGSMPHGDSRVLLDDDGGLAVLYALRDHPSVSLYVAAADDPTTNYLFTVEDTSGFDAMLEAFKENYLGRRYDAAMALWDAGEYSAAVAAFDSLGDYRDSAEWRGKYQGMLYEQAEALLADGDYEGASRAFASIGNYKDAAQRVKEPYYVQAEALMAAGDYDGASAAFEKAGDYKDAAQRVKEPYYVQAEALMVAGDYDGANAAFKAAGDYLDAADRVGEPYYVQAEVLLDAGDVVGAIGAFDKAGDYFDARERIQVLGRDLAADYLIALGMLTEDEAADDARFKDAVADFQRWINERRNETALEPTGELDDLTLAYLRYCVEHGMGPTATSAPQANNMGAVEAGEIAASGASFVLDGVRYYADAEVTFSWGGASGVSGYTLYVESEGGTRLPVGDTTETSRVVPLGYLPAGVYTLYVGAIPEGGSEADAAWSQMRFGVPNADIIERAESAGIVVD